ncbi:hypothetical protein ABPG72_014932 [Tetrahymena utriculariae]
MTIEKLKQFQQQIDELGFTNKAHFNEFYQNLKDAEYFTKDIEQFNNNIFLSAQKVEKLLESVIQSIDIMSKSCQKKLENTNEYFKAKIKEYLNNINHEKQFKDYETQEQIFSFIKHSDTGLQKLIDSDETLRKCTENLIQNLQNLEEISFLTNKTIKTKKVKGEAKVWTIEEYADKLFLKLYNMQYYNMQCQEYQDPKIAELTAEIKPLEKQQEEVEGNDNEKKANRLTQKIEKLQQKLEKFEEKQEEKQEQHYEKEFEKHKKKFTQERFHIQIIIQNFSSSLRLLEYRLRQQQIFAPILALKANYEDLNKSNQEIQKLSIAY